MSDYFLMTLATSGSTIRTSLSISGPLSPNGGITIPADNALTVSTGGALVVSGTTTLTGGLTVVGTATGVYQKPTGGIPNSDLATLLVIGTTSTTAMAGNKTAADLGGIQLGTTAGTALEATMVQNVNRVVKGLPNSNSWTRIGFFTQKTSSAPEICAKIDFLCFTYINWIVPNSIEEYGILVNNSALDNVGKSYRITKGSFAGNSVKLQMIRTAVGVMELWLFSTASTTSGPEKHLKLNMQYDESRITWTETAPPSDNPSAETVTTDPGVMDFPVKILIDAPPASGQYTLLSNNGVVSWVLSL
jgi:hypothetical protein